MRKTTKQLHTGLRYVPYQRCSTEDQAAGDFSTTTAQLQLNQEYILGQIAKSGGDLLSGYTDDGISGTRVSRPGLNRLLEDAKSKKFDVVVVTFMSRLGRGDAYTIIEQMLTKCGVRVEMVRESFGEGVGGYVARKVTNLMDGMYPVMVGGWVRTKQAAMVAQGYWPGGRPPFGCRTESVPGVTPNVDKYGKTVPPPRHLVADPDTLPLVIEGFEVFVRTGSLASVVRHFQSVATDAMYWNLDRVMRVLTNRTYMGVLSYGDNVNEAAHPPLFSPELFAEAQRLLATRQEDRSGLLTDPLPLRSDGYTKPERYDTNHYYLRGRVQCGACGRVMVPKSCKGKTTIVGYYECTTSIKHEGRCPVKRINADTLHRVVLAEIDRAGQHPSRLEAFIRDTLKTLRPSADAKQELRKIRPEEERLKKVLSRYERAIAEAGTVRTIMAAIRRTEKELSDLLAKKEEVERIALQDEARRPDTTIVARVLAEVLYLWEHANEERRTRLLRRAVMAVEMTAKGEGVLRLAMDVEAPTVPNREKEGNSITSPSRKFVFRASYTPESAGNTNSKVFPPHCNIPITVPLGGSRIPRIKAALRPPQNKGGS